ncbi:M48 family metallopeptidase [Pelagibius sp. Alg239-R121]|uniref:M48 family metallopeptidase n=1 Tax=Pelagibius sp. Alg239-R121 TaxID=2993448 RepID=UPI0024A770E7|nr:M48 family metallopeptidase [Pelagibius sp. Alg239-R121]
MQVEQAEAELKTSGRVVYDPELNKYVGEMVCRLAAEYCQDVRVYVVNAAGFNASMSPNGAMHVWTGLLLRVENEAQLANVLAHELAHYRQRHSLQRWRDIRAKTDGLVFFQIATAMVGAAPIGALASLAALDSIYGFSRDQEREADDLGFDSLTAAGYDPREAPRVWEFMIEEKEASDAPKRTFFFSTHPQSEERQETLAKKVDELGDLTDSLILGEERFRAQTLRFRSAWLAQEIKVGDFGRGIAMVERLLKRDPDAGELHFAKGELLRRRGGDGDYDDAVSAYEQAMKAIDYPASVHRSLALVQWSQGKDAQAAAAFHDYLEKKPDADDRLIIESYISQLK